MTPDAPPPPRSAVAGACFTLLPYWSAALGGPHPPGALFRAYALAQMLVAPLLCRLSDSRRVGRRLPVAAALALSAAACACFAGAWTMPQLAFAVAVSGAAAVAQPILTAAAADVCAASDVPPAYAFSALTVAAALGFVGGPPAAAAIASANGLHAAAAASSGAAAAAALLALLAMRDPAPDATSSSADEARPTPDAVPLISVRFGLGIAVAAFAAVLFPGHAERFALAPQQVGAVQAGMGATQIATWWLIATHAVRALGARRLQTLSLLAAAAALAAWAAASTAGGVAMPLAALAVFGALARVSNDTLLAGAARGRAGAVFGLAFAASEGGRQLLAPPAAAALAQAPAGSGGVAGAAALIALAAAGVSAALGVRAEAREATLLAAERRKAAAAALAAPTAALLPKPSPASASARSAAAVMPAPAASAASGVAASASAAAADASLPRAPGEGEFTGTVVLRRGAAAARFLEAEEAEASAIAAAAAALEADSSPPLRASPEVDALVRELLATQASLTQRRSAAATTATARQVKALRAALRAAGFDDDA